MTVNLFPDKYRGVSVTRVDGGLDVASLREFFIGRQAYFKTKYAVVSDGAGGTAILRVHTAKPTEPQPAEQQPTELQPAEPADLFLQIVDVELLASVEETAEVHDPEIDTGVPSELARAARMHAPSARAVVVHGRYEHISFIVDPQPLRIVVREVVPPRPAKLVDQAARIIAMREDLPPIELIADLVDLQDVASEHPADHYLLPCRGSGFEPGSGDVAYLDEHPAEQDWLMLGCTRSQQIHGEFYDRNAPQVSFCPRERPNSELLTLTKCCLQDDEIVVGEGFVSVPWGSSLTRVAEALERLVSLGSIAGIGSLDSRVGGQ
jgi:hypothetical protein